MNEDLDATTRLTHAITALTSTTPHVLHRDGQDARHDVDEAHLDHIRYLRKRLTRARDDEDEDRIRCAMRTAGQAHRARRAALRAEIASTPSLIEQLHDAVHGTGGTNGAHGKGAYRAAIGLAATQLLHDIRRTIGQRDGDLTDHLRAWQPEDLNQAADIAQHWPAEAQAILDPPNTRTAPGACPRCGETWIWTTEGDERIRRGAIQIRTHQDQSKDHAVCLNPRCDGHWPRTHWDLLSAALRAS